MSTNRRDAIRMTDDEIVDFLAAQKSLQVGTLERDSSIHLSTLWFALVDGKIVFETYTKSQKILNLQRDPRITVLAEDGLVYEQLRGIAPEGMQREDAEIGISACRGGPGSVGAVHIYQRLED